MVILRSLYNEIVEHVFGGFIGRRVMVPAPSTPLDANLESRAYT
jgi:hypothetical protein